jgi:glycerate dehydrogenase
MKHRIVFLDRSTIAPQIRLRRPVDEAALADALEQGLIAGAGFDVTDGEPPDLDSPLMRIAARPDVILTPHVAWASDEAQQALADQLVDNLEGFVAGRRSNVVV